MTRCDPSAVRQVAIVGCGVIGAGWAAHFLGRGLDVVATDPHPEGERRLREAVANAWPALERIGLAPGASLDRLRFSADLEVAVAEADVIQESAPEVEALKIELLARIDAAARPEAVIASSSSGLLPTRIQSETRLPGRIVIGHPFNPVYILPLVEVLGGEATEVEAVEWAMEFYRAVGKTPLRVRREVPAYIADRLMEALWREALHLVNDGVATTSEIDLAITGGAGLRWAFMGPCFTFHLAGGDRGMAHMLEQFGPALKLPWTRLEAPELTDELKERMVEGTAGEAEGRSVKELERKRDDVLIRIMNTIETHWHGDGQEKITTPYEGQAVRRWQPGEAVDAPLRLHETPVRSEWVDYNGHMSESCYLLVFGDASDALFRYIGIDEAYRASGRSLYTVETHMNNYLEASEGDLLTVTTQVLDLDPKRVHIFHAMYRDTDSALVATGEQMLLHVDMNGPSATPIRPEIYAPLEAIHAAHAGLPRPEQAGRSIAIRRQG